MTGSESLTKDATRMQRRVERMRRSLVDVAETILVEGGPAAVTAEEVARRADVSLQTVYNRIGGKSALLVAVAEQAAEQNRAYMDEAYRSDGTAAVRLQRACDAYMRFALERPHQFNIVANPPDDPEVVRPLIKVADAHIEQLAGLLSTAIAEGSVSSRLDAQSAAVALWAMMNGLLTMALRNQPAGANSVPSRDMLRAAETLLRFGIQGDAIP